MITGAAAQVAAKMCKAGIRVEVQGNASIAKLIRNAEKAKTPVMSVVGAKEADNNQLSVRLYGGADLGTLPVDDVVQGIVNANAARGNFQA